MRILGLFIGLLLSVQVHADLKSVDCEKLSRPPLNEVDDDEEFEKLLKTDFGKNVLEWADADFKSYRTMVASCRKPNEDESYYLEVLDRSIKWIKREGFGRKAEWEQKQVEWSESENKNNKTKADLENYKIQVPLLTKNVDEVKVNKLQEIKAALKALNVSPTSSDYETWLSVNMWVDNALSEYGKKKHEDKLNAEEKSRQAKFAAMNKKQQAEAGAAAKKARTENSSAFSKCEKIRSQLQKHLSAFEQIEKKYGTSMSDKMQNEGVKKLQAEMYEIDRLNPEFDDLACERFYAK